MACTYAALVAESAERLARAGVDSPRLDAEVLLARVLRCDRSALFARLRDQVESTARRSMARLVERRLRREPVAYIVGEKEFYSLRFRVDPSVLIPRPETELVVERALGRLAEPLAAAARVVDVGTGSGCIAVTLAVRAPRARILALDSSPAALALAAENATAHAVGDRIEWLVSDLFSAIAAGETFDVIVANPPYVADGEPLPPDLAFEPAPALRAGPSGMDVIDRLLAQSWPRLRRAGCVIFEIGETQSVLARESARRAGFERFEIAADLAGKARVCIAEKT